MVKLLVFDWDGTLADSISKIIDCKQFLARKFNLPLPSEKVMSEVLGTKFEDALKICFPKATSTTLNNFAQEFHRLMQQSDYQTLLFPHVKKMLYQLKAQGVKLGIATSKDREELNSAIIAHDLSGAFDITCCGKEYEEKPHPGMLMHIMKSLQVSPDECLMIGDTTTDLLFAQNAGVKAIAVTFGAHSVSQLQMLHPIGLIDKWTQLPEVLENYAD